MPDVTVLILAGGRATRMGGRDKGLLEIGGETLVSRLVRRLEPQATSLIINANRNIERYAETGVPVVEDTVPDFQGPLAGMLSGLGAVETEWMITLPCDGPVVADDYVRRMMDAVTRSGNALAVASDGDRLQPVYALVNRSLAEGLQEFLATGERKIDRWYGGIPHDVVDFSDRLDMFTNVNTPEDLAAFSDLAGN